MFLICFGLQKRIQALVCIPGNGILVVLPTDQVRGLIDHKKNIPGNE
jgi:hypothetical protein